MIVVELLGGLGNQLFQYAVGRATALRLGTSLALDTRHLDRDPKRKLALDVFRVRATVFSAWRRPAWGLDAAWRPWLRMAVAERMGQALPIARFKEDDSAGTFDPDIAQVRGSAVLSGYFQSPRYFDDIADALRRDLTLREPPRPAFLQALSAIALTGPASVSLHIRRGDYANDPKVAAGHGMLGFDYYHRALEALAPQLPHPSVFVFTDDVGAAAEIEGPGLRAQVLSGQGFSDAEEMMLMAACRHHVIANSSFSWWGAWLGQGSGLTVAPRRWFARESAVSIKDRFPSHWHVV